MVSCGVGSCRRSGTKTCADSQITITCEPGVPTFDSCDGADNDCDGAVDELFQSEVTTCGLGFCQRTGTTFCRLGEVEDSCTPLDILNATDLCDGIDSDCDGQVDEDHVRLVTSCGVGACSAEGRLRCINGSVSDSCIANLPVNGDVDSVCDAVDSDCDGRADEGFREAVNCGVGAVLRQESGLASMEIAAERLVIGQASDNDSSWTGSIRTVTKC